MYLASFAPSRRRQRSNRYHAQARAEDQGAQATARRAGTRRRIEIRRRASIMFSSSHQASHATISAPPIRWQHLEDVLRALGQDQPVQVTALADDVQGLRSPLIGHLVVLEITERHAENPTPFAGRSRLAIPPVWGAATASLVRRRGPPHSTRPYRASSCASA
jgi:hypothetical protein